MRTVIRINHLHPGREEKYGCGKDGRLDIFLSLLNAFFKQVYVGPAREEVVPIPDTLSVS
jgi:hypothetical protein